MTLSFYGSVLSRLGASGFLWAVQILWQALLMVFPARIGLAEARFDCGGWHGLAEQKALGELDPL